MGDRWLTDLADVLRAAGLTVVEQDGWQTRARGSGGFDGTRPWCVMWHHTASSPTSTAEGDASYMSNGSPDRPIANLMIARDGAVWVLAAGATNTNGSGDALRFTRGTVPANSMNTHAIGMEIQNTGVGEPYAQACIDAAFTTSLALAAAYGLDPADVATHNLYAPTRKIDPATATAVQGAWQPAAVTSSGTWSIDDLRGELARRAANPVPQPEPPTPTPPDTLGDDAMPFLLENTGTGEYALVYGVGLVIGLAGPDVPFYADRFGDALPCDPVIWGYYVSNSNAMLGR